MVDYSHSVAIQVNLFQIMWPIKWYGGSTKGRLMEIHRVAAQYTMLTQHGKKL